MNDKVNNNRQGADANNQFVGEEPWVQYFRTAKIDQPTGVVFNEDWKV